MPEVKILDVMLSKATTGMLIAELLQRKMTRISSYLWVKALCYLMDNCNY